MTSLASALTTDRLNSPMESSVIGIIIALTLLVLLVSRDLVELSETTWAVSYARILNIVIIPLFATFALISVVNLAGAIW